MPIDRKHPKLRAKQAVKDDEVEAPPCPIHRVDMLFDPDTLRWSCQRKGCTQVAYPASDLARKRPDILSGDLELVEIGEEGLYIRHVEYNVFIKIDDYLVNANVEDGYVDLHIPTVVSIPSVQVAERKQ